MTSYIQNHILVGTTKQYIKTPTRLLIFMVYTLIWTLTKILERFLENLLFLGWQHWQKREKTRNPWNLIWNFNYSHHWKKYVLQNESIKRIFTLTNSLNLSMPSTYLPFMLWRLCKATINHLFHATMYKVKEFLYITFAFASFNLDFMT